MPKLLILQSQFYVSTNLSAIIWFSKAICCNMVASLPDHKNKWELALHMNGYYVVWVTAIPYLGFDRILNIVSKEDRICLISITNHPQCTSLTLQICHQWQWKRGVNGYPTNILYYVLRYLCKVDYATNKFIHTPTFNYNGMMHLLKLAIVAEHAYSDVSECHGHTISNIKMCMFA
jgi:hypothetical protein